MTTRDHIEDVMYGRRRSFLLGAALRFLSCLYGLVVRTRRLLYSLKLFRTKRLQVTVISVGNLTLGGTGKTPAVISIVKLLKDHGRKPSVVSRGYGRKNSSSMLVVSDGSSAVINAAEAGDEPALMGMKLPGVPVLVGSDRYEAGIFAHQVFGPDTIVLDDGFQHLRVARDLDILLVDAVDPFGNGRLFPAGILREPLSALRRADAVVITRSESVPELGPLKALIGRYAKAPLFSASYRPVGLFDVNAEDVRPVSALRGLPVLLFSGIARPEPFRVMLMSLGAQIRAHTVYPDHHVYTKQDLAAIYHQASDKGATMIVTTEKDAVKMKPFHTEGIWALGVELNISENEEWEKLVLGQRVKGGKLRN